MADVQPLPFDITTLSEAARKIDLLTATASSLQSLLSDENAGITSLDLVKVYLAQIHKHNHVGANLHAVLSIAPWEVLSKRAEQLDSERRQHKSRGPLHGIPIVIKDNIMTDESLGMDTTNGTYALVGAKARNAPLVNILLERGLIILGKANLSEWSGLKGYPHHIGWSPVGGQTQSPYIKGGIVKTEKWAGHSTTLGSSSGSASSVGAGFAPIAIATEADGSTIQPASRSSLYALKLAPGTTDVSGIAPVVKGLDTVGLMAKTTTDLVALFSAISGNNCADLLKDVTWKGKRIGALSPEKWRLSEFLTEIVESFQDEQTEAITQALSKIDQAGGSCSWIDDLPSYDSVLWDGREGFEVLMFHGLKKEIEAYLSLYTESKVRTVTDLIDFHNAHPELELPPDANNHGAFEQALLPSMIQPNIDEIEDSVTKQAKDNGLDAVFEKHNLDLLIGPTDSRLVSMAALSRYPCATVPLGYADNLNGRPYGLTMVVNSTKEEDLLRFVAAWEMTMPPRRPPPPLRDWDTEHPDHKL